MNLANCSAPTGPSNNQTKIPASSTEGVPPPNTVPQTSSTVKSASDGVLKSRKDTVNKESFNIAQSLSSIETSQDYIYNQDAQNKSKELRSQLKTLSDENKLIANEQKSRINTA